LRLRSNSGEFGYAIVSYELPTGVRWILFDAVGTLIYPDPPVAEAYRAVALRFGLELSIATIGQRFASAVSHEQNSVPGSSLGPHCREAPASRAAREAGASGKCVPREDPGNEKPTRPPTSEPLERARWQRVVAAVFEELPSATGEPFELLWHHFAQPGAWQLFDDVAPSLAELARRGYRLGIASNFDSRLSGIARALPPLAACERVFVSSEIGFSKPDERFFSGVEQRLGTFPRQMLLVGDDAVNDHEGALAAGWHAALLHREGPPASHEHISALSELTPFRA
jgi:putative hydrolase of the HAD superfamily